MAKCANLVKRCLASCYRSQIAKKLEMKDNEKQCCFVFTPNAFGKKIQSSPWIADVDLTLGHSRWAATVAILSYSLNHLWTTAFGRDEIYW